MLTVLFSEKCAMYGGSESPGDLKRKRQDSSKANFDPILLISTAYNCALRVTFFLDKKGSACLQTPLEAINPSFVFHLN